MKKIALFTLAVIFGLSFGQAQGDFTAGIHGGLPIGDAGDLATFAIAVELGYLFDVSDEFKAGPTLGYSHSFGEDIDTGFGTFEVDDIQFLPIAAAGRFSITDEFSLGADLGYAIGINDGNDGGFYYAPRAAYSVSEAIDIVLAYRGVSLDGGSWDIISLGLEFGID
ncbi:outer membrane beta-barrel protein [Flagellimonas lutimaris]|uniref:outer membrane beta-barrel protein n=1 Tax=Flagellimonas lutimaris TaxID=475082 RepID=UPI0016017BF8|nr:outer membrane beta-barrel protein [Allomuricauda lutimaris]